MGPRKFPVVKVEGCLFVCLFVWRFTSPSRIFFTHLETSLSPVVKGYNFWHSAIEQWGFLNVTCLLCHGPTLRRTRDTYTCCRAFGCLDCHNGEPRSPECVANALHVLLRHRGGQSWKKDVQELMQFYCIVLNTGYIL